ncbi:hypothetical protein MRX96_052635 [Rhipicephalus microplus]
MRMETTLARVRARHVDYASCVYGGRSILCLLSMICRSFEIDDGCLVKAKTTRTHEDLPLRSKERRQGIRETRITAADYDVFSTISRPKTADVPIDVKRTTATPTSEDFTPSKPKQATAAYNAGTTRASSKVSAIHNRQEHRDYRDSVEDPKSTD